MSSLLLDEKPLIILPRLAVTIGLNEAVILQQLHDWLTEKRHNPEKYAPSFIGVQWWVYNTLAEWQTQFPFWSVMTIRRTLESLEAQGLLVSDTLSPDKRDRTKWYRIDYDVLKAREAVPEDDPGGVNLNTSISPKRTRASVQIEQMPSVQNDHKQRLKKNSSFLTETPSENTQRTLQKAAAPPGDLPSASSEKSKDKTDHERAVIKQGAAKIKAALEQAAKKGTQPDFP